MRGHECRRDWILRAVVMACFLFLLAGPSSASRHSRDITLKSPELQEIILDHIEKNMPWDSGSARVEFLSRIKDVTLRGNDINYRVDARRNENYIGQTTFRIRFYDGGLFLVDQAFRVKIEVSKDFVVSARNLDDGSLIGEGDVTVIQRWVDRVPRNRIADPAQVTGRMLRGSIGHNTELQERMLRNPEMVKSGDLVRVILSRGSLYMETMGVSAEAGSLGDRIRIRNASSNNLFYARVVEESVVRVDF